MNNRFENYTNKAKEVNMTADEKARIFDYLNRVVKTDSDIEISEPSFIKTPFFFYFSRQKVAVFAVLAIFLLTAGTSFAAQSSLPGEPLYPLKINVNEKVAGFIAARSGKEVSFEADTALKRLEEAEQLNANGKLDSNTGKEIESNFEEHSANVQVALLASSSLDYDQAEEAMVNFQSGLIAHQKILVRLSQTDNKDAESSDLASIISKVDSQLKNNSDTEPVLAAKFQSSISSVNETKVKDKLNAAKTKIADTETYLNDSSVAPDTSIEAKAALSEATNLLSSGSTSLNQKSYQDAYILLDQASSLADQAKNSIKIESRAQGFLKQYGRDGGSTATSSYSADYASFNANNINKSASSSTLNRQLNISTSNSIQ